MNIPGIGPAKPTGADPGGGIPTLAVFAAALLLLLDAGILALFPPRGGAPVS